MKANQKSKIGGKELAGYIVSGAFCLIGIVMIVFNFIGKAIEKSGVASDHNWVLNSENKALVGWSKMGWLYWGLIFVAIAVIIFVAVAEYNAKKTDRDSDKEARRKQRLDSVITENVNPAIREIKTEAPAPAPVEAAPAPAPVEAKEVEAPAEEQKEPDAPAEEKPAEEVSEPEAPAEEPKENAENKEEAAE